MMISVENMGKLNEALDGIVDSCNQGLMGNARTSILDVKCLALEAKKILTETVITDDDKNKTGGDAA